MYFFNKETVYIQQNYDNFYLLHRLFLACTTPATSIPRVSRGRGTKLNGFQEMVIGTTLGTTLFTWYHMYHTLWYKNDV